MTGDAAHWDDRYRTIGSQQVSWYQPTPHRSVHFIEEVLGTPRQAPIVDVGGGASRLVDALLDDGYRDVTVVDLSQAALDEAQTRVGDHEGASLAWIQADLRTWTPERPYGLWHDRAVYHFLTEPADQQRYWQLVRDHVVPGGHVVIATFAEDGPTMCSGLPVSRYSTEELLAAMGAGFTPVTSQRELHITPSGGEQAFTWVVARRD